MVTGSQQKTELKIAGSEYTLPFLIHKWINEYQTQQFTEHITVIFTELLTEFLTVLFTEQHNETSFI